MSVLSMVAATSVVLGCVALAAFAGALFGWELHRRKVERERPSPDERWRLGYEYGWYHHKRPVRLGIDTPTPGHWVAGQFSPVPQSGKRHDDQVVVTSIPNDVMLTEIPDDARVFLVTDHGSPQRIWPPSDGGQR